MYSTTTHSIEVTVKPFYLEDQSSPREGHFVWAYWVRIENQGLEPVRLRNRYWKITDSLGRMQEVRGPGVVGEQPRLGPGEVFEYTSGTPLSTASGIMVGGIFTSILTSHLVGVVPVSIEDRFWFTGPVKFGDTLTIEVWIADKNADDRTIVWEASATNQDGGEVLTARATMKYPRRPPPRM